MAGGKIIETAGGTIQSNVTEKFETFSGGGISMTAANQNQFRGNRGGVLLAKTKKTNKLEVIKITGPYDENNQLVTEMIKGKRYSFKAEFNRKATDSEVNQTVWVYAWENNMNDRHLFDPSTKKILPGKSISIQTGYIPNNLNYKKVAVYAYVYQPTAKGVVVNVTSLYPMLIIQGKHRKGRNDPNTDIADDMRYSTYTENEAGYNKLEQEITQERLRKLRAGNTGLFGSGNFRKSDADLFNEADSGAKNIVKKVKEYCKKSNSELFKIFKDGTDQFTSSGNRDVLHSMVDKVMRNEGGEFYSVNLTKTASEFDKIKTFITEVNKIILNEIKKNKNNIKRLQITNPQTDNGIIYPLMKDIKKPLLDDRSNGLKIAVNDVWAYQVFIKSCTISGNQYNLDLEYIFWDHFGLDMPDIEKFGDANGWGYNLDIFIAWFVLQHFKGFKPFITKIPIVKSYKGSF
jgi:Protein of unknown function (DUF3289)